MPAFAISGRTGEGFDRLQQGIEGSDEAGRRIAEVDYDTYAEGEAELGWLNCALEVTSRDPFDLDAVILELAGELGEALASRDADVAHLKILAQTSGAHGVANLLRCGAVAELSRPSRTRASQASLVVNARVFSNPQELRDDLDRVLWRLASRRGIEVTLGGIRSFRPGRPIPTHRYSDSV